MAISVENVIADLGANYRDDESVLEDIINRMSSIAFDASNSKSEKLEPYIIDAVKAEYLARGAEGLNSRGEGSESSSFRNIMEDLRNNIVKNGLRRVY